MNAFFFGRMSAPVAETPAPSPAGAPAPAGAPEPAGALEPVPGPAPEPMHPSAMQAPPKPVTPAEPMLVKGPNGELTITAAPASSRVNAYFERIASIQAGPSGTDPQAFAGQLIQGTLSGDFSGFDGLVKSLESAEAEARKVEVPPECRAYHDKLVEHLGTGKKVMKDLRAALEKKDPEALQTLGQQAAAMQNQVEALKELEAQIRARRGS